MKGSAKQIAVIGLFCALSVLGAQIHIFGSVALDALPAFLAAFLLGGMPAAIVGAVGHLLTALFSGFPLTVPLHLVIAVEMAALCYITGRVAVKKPLLFAAIVGFVLNALVSPLILLVWPGMGLAICLALLPMLALGSAINAFGAALVAVLLKNRIPELAKWRS